MVSTPTLNFRSMRFSVIRRCVSPKPDSKVWRVSSLRSKRRVGSSSQARRSDIESLSSSARVRGTTATDSIGCESGPISAVTAEPEAERVSPVLVSLSLAVAAMSPGAISERSMLVAP